MNRSMKAVVPTTSLAFVLEFWSWGSSFMMVLKQRPMSFFGTREIATTSLNERSTPSSRQAIKTHAAAIAGTPRFRRHFESYTSLNLSFARDTMPSGSWALSHCSEISRKPFLSIYRLRLWLNFGLRVF